MLKNLQRVLVLALGAFGALAISAVAAFATPTAVDTAIDGAADGALAVITTNMPVVFAVAAAFVAWKVGKRVLGKI